MTRKSTTRRAFLKRSAAAAASAVLLPAVLPPGAVGASERLPIGHIGLGGRGSGLLDQSLRAAAVEVVSIRSRELPLADIEVGHRTTSICQLGNIALWTGRKLRWDWREEKFIDDSEANSYLSREYREAYRPKPAKA